MTTRKPAIYLVIILPILLLGFLLLSKILISAFLMYRILPTPAIPAVNGMLIVLPALILWIPVSLLISNCILFVIPALRKIAENYVEKERSFTFIESQRMLIKIAVIHAAICVPLIILGFIV